MNNTMLHMKLNSAVSIFAVAAAFAVFLPPSNVSAGICFLPDCIDEDVVQGDINMNINSDTEYCEEKGYTYYSSGECPQYQAKVGTCSRDDHYLKCDAVKWCKDNGYNTQTCSLPSFVNDQCPNGKPYYKGCKEDRPRACREQGYVNSCSPGRLYKSTNRCPWDSSYGKCCTASPSTGCPSNYKVTCDSSRGSSGTDTCGYTCGTACKRCKGCPSGTSTSYHGTFSTTSECGSCYKCSNTCSSGSTSSSCGSGYESYRSGSTECGSACYSCRKHTHSYSCPSGYKSSSCGSGYTTSSTRSRSCSCGATSGTCYKCSKNSTSNNNDYNNNYTGDGNTGNNNNNNNNTNTGTTTPSTPSCTDTCSSKGYLSSKPSGNYVTKTVCSKTCYCSYNAVQRFDTATACQDNTGEGNCSIKKFCGMIAATCSFDLYKNGSLVKQYYTRANGYKTKAECEAGRGGDKCSGGLSEAMSAAKKLCN